MDAPLYLFERPRSLPEPLRVVVLGATGSIGRQALELVRLFPERLTLVAVSIHSRWRELPGLLKGLQALVVIDDPVARSAAANDGVFGDALLAEGTAESLAAQAECDVVVNGIVGAAGLAPALAAARRGLRIALANKESLVVGGMLMRETARACGAEVLPVDSEHSAIAQCLSGREREDLRRIILTASGGPFRTKSAQELAAVTVDEVLAHPTWSMGPKITVDCATLMNKGLEVIEAHHLFGVPYDDIEVVVHPGSWVHSLVQMRDGALLAQLGSPDMRLPLLYAITGEQRWPLPSATLDLASIGSLCFEAPDTQRFPCLDLARQAGREGGSAPITLNAANEVAVAALLRGELPYIELAGLVAAALDCLPTTPVGDLETALEADRLARRTAERLLEGRRLFFNPDCS